MMGFNCKIPSNNSKREILLLKKKEIVANETAEHFNFTLPALSSHLRIKDADLVTENKQEKNRSAWIIKRGRKSHD
jgi:hypothetical protein